MKVAHCAIINASQSNLLIQRSALVDDGTLQVHQLILA